MKVRLAEVEHFMCNECRFTFYFLNSEEDRIYPNFCPNCGIELERCPYYNHKSESVLCKKVTNGNP